MTYENHSWSQPKNVSLSIDKSSKLQEQHALLYKVIIVLKLKLVERKVGVSRKPTQNIANIGGGKATPQWAYSCISHL